MTYAESDALTSDLAFGGRVKIACLRFADSIMNESPAQPAHNARQRWATLCFQNPMQVALQVQPPTVMDPGVQADGPAITDAALQSAVEATINKFF